MKTFEQCKKDPVKTIYADFEDGDYRGLVLRGPVSLCAYVGVRKDHPYFGHDYFEEIVILDVHGGLTFSTEGKDNCFPWPAGWWWFGWDYGHYRDASFYDIYHDFDEHRWIPDEVLVDVKRAIEELKRIKEGMR